MKTAAYYTSNNITIYHGDFREYLHLLPSDGLVITDPPYNIGFSKYDIHNDNMPDDDYVEMLAELQKFYRVVIIHYPIETMRWVIPALGIPDAIVAWCYNANIPNRFRLISFYGCNPDYSRIKQQYKNPKDRRIKRLIANGSKGTSLYEWWTDIQLVKNTSTEKGKHPCPIPQKLIRRIITLLISDKITTIIDPFAGGLTVPKVAYDMNLYAIGCEKSEAYILDGLNGLR